jgi:hypothetical protein
MPQGKKVTELPVQNVVLLRQEWEKGDLPVKVLSLIHGVDIEDLRATAKREGWGAEKAAESSSTATEAPIQVEIERAAVEANVVRVVSEDDAEHGRTAPTVMDRGSTVKQFGMVLAGVQSQHRTDIRRARAYATGLMQQLEELVGPHVEKARVEALAKLIAADDPELAKLLTDTPEPGDFAGKLRVLDKKATVLVKLVQAQERLITMERAAFGLDKQGGAAAGYDELLEEIHKQQRNVKSGRLLS